MNSIERIFLPSFHSRVFRANPEVNVPQADKRGCRLTVRAFLIERYQAVCRLEQAHVVRVLLVQSVSVFRIIGTLLFIGLPVISQSRILLATLYVAAILSDLVDGYLARTLQVSSNFGRVLDLVADKSLALVSLLYAADHGVEILPLAIIATRDMLMIGMRLVTIDGMQLLPTNRVFGGLMAFLIGTNTLLLLYSAGPALVQFVTISYWGIALLFVANLGCRIHTSWSRILRASRIDFQMANSKEDNIRRCRCCGQYHEIPITDKDADLVA